MTLANRHKEVKRGDPIRAEHTNKMVRDLNGLQLAPNSYNAKGLSLSRRSNNGIEGGGDREPGKTYLVEVVAEIPARSGTTLGKSATEPHARRCDVDVESGDITTGAQVTAFNSSAIKMVPNAADGTFWQATFLGFAEDDEEVYMLTAPNDPTAIEGYAPAADQYQGKLAGAPPKWLSDANGATGGDPSNCNTPTVETYTIVTDVQCIDGVLTVFDDEITVLTCTPA